MGRGTSARAQRRGAAVGALQGPEAQRRGRCRTHQQTAASPCRASPAASSWGPAAFGSGPRMRPGSASSRRGARRLWLRRGRQAGTSGCGEPCGCEEPCGQGSPGRRLEARTCGSIRLSCQRSPSSCAYETGTSIPLGGLTSRPALAEVWDRSSDVQRSRAARWAGCIATRCRPAKWASRLAGGKPRARMGSKAEGTREAAGGLLWKGGGGAAGGLRQGTRAQVIQTLPAQTAARATLASLRS